MTSEFNAAQGLVIVTARIFGPAADSYLRLALDTGATTTLLNDDTLRLLGYDLESAEEDAKLVTGSDIVVARRIRLQRIEALGCSQADFPVISHTLPELASIDGLLGLDFLRDGRLTIDFRKGRLTLT